MKQAWFNVIDITTIECPETTSGPARPTEVYTAPINRATAWDALSASATTMCAPPPAPTLVLPSQQAPSRQYRARLCQRRSAWLLSGICTTQTETHYDKETHIQPLSYVSQVERKVSLTQGQHWDHSPYESVVKN